MFSGGKRIFLLQLKIDLIQKAGRVTARKALLTHLKEKALSRSHLAELFVRKEAELCSFHVGDVICLQQQASCCKFLPFQILACIECFSVLAGSAACTCLKLFSVRDADYMKMHEILYTQLSQRSVLPTTVSGC